MSIGATRGGSCGEGTDGVETSAHQPRADWPHTRTSAAPPLGESGKYAPHRRSCHARVIRSTRHSRRTSGRELAAEALRAVRHVPRFASRAHRNTPIRVEPPHIPPILDTPRSDTKKAPEGALVHVLARLSNFPSSLVPAGRSHCPGRLAAP